MSAKLHQLAALIDDEEEDDESHTDEEDDDDDDDDDDEDIDRAVNAVTSRFQHRRRHHLRPNRARSRRWHHAVAVPHAEVVKARRQGNELAGHLEELETSLEPVERQCDMKIRELLRKFHSQAPHPGFSVLLSPICDGSFPARLARAITTLSSTTPHLFA